jgi:MarR family transcriptional regulator, lower aerobic nicotinate degradation pathway regulator
MQEKYQKLWEVVQLWDKYESESATPSVGDFGNWLVASHLANDDDVREPDVAVRVDGVQFPLRQLPQIGDVYDENEPDAIPIEAVILTLIRRLYRFSTIYSKKALAEFELGSNEDYVYLLSLFYDMREPRKSELVEAHLSEFSSGIEVIKRLIKTGLVEEFDDTGDRRSKRVKITEKGREVMLKSMLPLKDILATLFAGMRRAEKNHLAKLMLSMDERHTAVLGVIKDGTMPEILSALKQEAFRRESMR